MFKINKMNPSTYVSIEITNFFDLSKKTSSFKFKEFLLLDDNLENIFL